MRAGPLPFFGAAITALSGVSAQSYNTIPEIEIYGQKFFFANGSQLSDRRLTSRSLMRGVAYQENYSPNGTASTNTKYTDPLADADKCKRDIPYLQQIYTNLIRVYAIDPSQNHDDCMTQLADAGIYVIADLGEPGTSIESNDPMWDVTLYRRYTSVVDTLQKYKNVVGFFAGNENVSAGNQTAAAAFVKAAVRDVKGYISSQNYRKTLGVGYATADVPTRNELAHYFACQPGDLGNQTAIDFWGYNVYSWCGDSTYQQSSYGERVNFFKDYPVPVFFAEYGCNENLPGGPTSRPFTEVEVLYGNMTDVFSGGIVYEYFMGENEFGLVSIDGSNVSPYPDFTSLKSQLATISPTTTAKSDYKPSNSAPACPSVGSSWEAKATPLPPSVNPQLCSCMVQNLQCNIKSNDAEGYGAVFDYICGQKEELCSGIAHNATTGSYGAISGCDPKDQLAWVANQWFLSNNKQARACDFSGMATTQAATVASGCQSVLDAVGTAGTGTVASPTGKGTEGATAATSSSKGAAPGLSSPAFFEHGHLIFGAYVSVAVISLVGMFAL
ncbi:carbohydrate-binding module family 43 protein [Aaosphaeria arxii CBS 175.79]|uniref:1,3-beta-glucanosyltransferase n=1 Tax=Aaosphaeria arxii CBS 175.79 TaxID=1450172 RepID=A0A6A5YC26_9PLEO|nr:carbohydrate-binding module family 43 protein [Aaosphaeria arxii CBS 175.79]KAF2022240.1 carbohydrate-binding module family 43 protein [Aaosphaeria arxii CBS 175.79]